MAQKALFGAPKSSKRELRTTRRKNTVDNGSIKGDTSTTSGKVKLARRMVESLLGHKREHLMSLSQEQEVYTYVSKCIDNGIAGIDTETEGLNTQENMIAGVCLYTPGEKGVYVPINHKSYMTGVRLKDQVEPDFVANQLQRLVDNNVKMIFHNYKFDAHVCYYQLGVKMKCYWDTMIAGWMLNENEPHGLKYLWDKYCKPVAEEESKELATFNTLFKGLVFTMIPLDIAYLYAGEDPKMTYELYKFQKKNLEKPKLERVYKLFTDIEMPCLQVLVDMEEDGIELDLDYCKFLHDKYQKQLNDSEEAVYSILEEYRDDISDFKQMNPVKGAKLYNDNPSRVPITVTSPTQLSILMYDIMKLPDMSGKRGTGKDELKPLKDRYPLFGAILKYREVTKLMSTYIDALPAQISKRTGKLHGQYNLIGAATGRMSSQEPNLQNIPSHNTEIRQMFYAGNDKCFVGSDFSGQEPRILAHLAHEEKMQQAYRENRDLYAFIGSLCFHVPYEDCLEFAPDGSKNPPECKERRSKAKACLLGLLYGMGPGTMSQNMGVSKEEAVQIINKFFKEFPGIQKFIEDTHDMAYDLGYVETYDGRKRRLPDLLLDEVELVVDDVSKTLAFNPLIDDEDFDYDPEYIDDETYYYWVEKYQKCWTRKQKAKVKEEALAQGYKIIDNGGKIADAERQTVNSVIQGSAAGMTKKALLNIVNDKLMQEWEAKPALLVHDEIIVTCPIKYCDKVAERLSYLMVSAASDLDTPFKCDTEVSLVWYGKTYEPSELIKLWEEGKIVNGRELQDN